MAFQIRPAVESDIPHILKLIQQFAEFEDLAEYCQVSEKKLQIALFSETAIAQAIVAIDNETPVGYAIFFPFFSSFRGQTGLYLEDIYLKPEMRGKGLGEKMLRFLAQLGKSRGFERIDFQVLTWNKSAINFYTKLGAVIDENERHCKFTDQAFQRLAS